MQTNAVVPQFATLILSVVLDANRVGQEPNQNQWWDSGEIWSVFIQFSLWPELWREWPSWTKVHCYLRRKSRRNSLYLAKECISSLISRWTLRKRAVYYPPVLLVGWNEVTDEMRFLPQKCVCARVPTHTHTHTLPDMNQVYSTKNFCREMICLFL